MDQIIPVCCSDAFALMRNMINKLVKFGSSKNHRHTNKQTKLNEKKKLYEIEVAKYLHLATIF